MWVARGGTLWRVGGARRGGSSPCCGRPKWPWRRNNRWRRPRGSGGDGGRRCWCWRKEGAVACGSPRPGGLGSWRGRGRAAAGGGGQPDPAGSGRGKLPGPTRRRRAVTQAQRVLAAPGVWGLPAVGPAPGGGASGGRKGPGCRGGNPRRGRLWPAGHSCVRLRPICRNSRLGQRIRLAARTHKRAALAAAGRGGAKHTRNALAIGVARQTPGRQLCFKASQRLLACPTVFPPTRAQTRPVAPSDAPQHPKPPSTPNHHAHTHAAREPKPNPKPQTGPTPQP